jgi:hypothetical protein
MARTYMELFKNDLLKKGKFHLEFFQNLFLQFDQLHASAGQYIKQEPEISLSKETTLHEKSLKDTAESKKKNEEVTHMNLFLNQDEWEPSVEDLLESPTREMSIDDLLRDFPLH